MTFYRSYWLTGDTAFIESLVEVGDELGLNVLPVFAYSLKDGDAERWPDALRYFVDTENRPLVDVVINTMSFAMGSSTAEDRDEGEWAVEALLALDVPQLQAINASVASAEWADSEAGLSPLDVAMNVAIPELDGRIIGVPLSFKEVESTTIEGSPVVRHVALRDRSARILGQARRLAILRRKPSAEKRVAVVLTNHNAKAARIANAVGLDSPASVLELLHSLDLERTLRQGERYFEPGLLAAAHRGVLYIDEVNLLPDHLVDLLLDVAASGVNSVEREGISVRHPARFLLVGTMNPEEGDVRPQFVDRFGLSVTVTAPRDEAERMEVVRRRMAYDADPERFAAHWSEEEAPVAARVRDARSRLANVDLPEALLALTVRICLEANVDGLRADPTILRAACALAALDGRERVLEDDVYRAALLVLPHRRRPHPQEPPPGGAPPPSIEQIIEQHRAESEQSRESSESAASNGHGADSDDDRGPAAPGPAGERAEPDAACHRHLLEAESGPAKPLAVAELLSVKDAVGLSAHRTGIDVPRTSLHLPQP